MRKVTINEIIRNLNKWRDICTIMNSKKGIMIVDEAIEKIKKSCTKEENVETKNNKETNIDKLNKILEAIDENNELILIEYKLVVIRLNINLEEEWDKLSESKKSKLSKLELNVIYSMLYKPLEIKYINKTKTEIIKDINYFIKDEKREKSLKENNLI